ncbi:MAG: hypothetical protein Q9214_004192 [Letrouitia sp. 1 TL-2023]
MSIIDIKEDAIVVPQKEPATQIVGGSEGLKVDDTIGSDTDLVGLSKQMCKISVKHNLGTVRDSRKSKAIRRRRHPMSVPERNAVSPSGILVAEVMDCDALPQTPGPQDTCKVRWRRYKTLTTRAEVELEEKYRVIYLEDIKNEATTTFVMPFYISIDDLKRYMQSLGNPRVDSFVGPSASGDASRARITVNKEEESKALHMALDLLWREPISFESSAELLIEKAGRLVDSFEDSYLEDGMESAVYDFAWGVAGGFDEGPDKSLDYDDSEDMGSGEDIESTDNDGDSDRLMEEDEIPRS